MTPNQEPVTKCEHGVPGTCLECYNDHIATPNQEPVERWEEQFDKIAHQFNDTFEIKNGRDQAIIKFFKEAISHQKALSRAEVLEEVRGKIEGMRVITMIKPSKFGDGKPTQIPTSEWGEGFNKALSDTLAVVDELKGNN